MKPAALLWITQAFALAACTTDLGIKETRRQQRVADNPAAMMRIAGAAEKAGDPASAEVFYQRAADLRPQDAVAAISLARSLAEQGYNDAAMAVLQKAHEMLPGNILVAATLGRLLVAMRQPEQALAAFEDGLRADPRSVSLLIGRGVALDALGQHFPAQECYQAALAIAPHNVAAQNDLALSLVLSGHADQAVGLLRALRQASDPADAATVSGTLAFAADSQAGPADASANKRLLATGTLFPKLPAPGGASGEAHGGAGTTGLAGTAADAAPVGAPPP